MLGFKDYRKLTETTPDAGLPASGNDQVTSVQAQVNQIVDAWVSELKRLLISPQTGDTRRGVWDRFKNSMANMWHGRYNTSNPYFWKNKLGDDLGAVDDIGPDNPEPTKEHFNPNNLSLADYKSLKDICESLEEQLNEDIPGTENLRLVRIIDNKAKELKQKLTSIVTGEAPAAQDQPNESPIEPTPVAAPSEPEEPNTKIDDGTKSLIDTVKKWAASGRIDAKQAQEVLSKLGSKKESIRIQGQNEFAKLGNASWASDSHSPASSGTPTPDNPVADPKSPDEDDPELGGNISFLKPPTTGKKWNELNPDEKARWDIFGGGASHEDGQKIDGCLNDHGIFKMPWIMRLGDPRREILAAQKEGRLPQSKKCINKKVGSHWFDFLHKTGRWEMAEEPIKGATQYLTAIDMAKEFTQKIRDKRAAGRIKPPSESDTIRNAAKEDESPIVPSPIVPSPEAPTPATPEPTVEPKKPSLRDRVASIGSEVPEVDKFTGTGLSEPMHKNDEAPTPPRNIKDRVAGIEGADAIPNPTKDEPEKSPREMRNELKAKIQSWSTDDQDTKEQLLRSLRAAKNKEEIQDIENEFRNHDFLQSQGDIAFEWTLKDSTNFYKEKLRAR